MLTKKQARKLGYSDTINVKYQIDSEYVNEQSNKWFKNKLFNFTYEFIFIVAIINLIIVWMLFFSKADAYEEKHTLDIKIEKFCKQYWEEKWLQDYISKCIKHWKAQMRFETGWICKNKDYNHNCFNFRSISKNNRKWFDINWVDKSWFTIFWDKTNSIKYFAYRFYLYDYRKTTEQIVGWGCYKNLQGKQVCFSWFTHSTGHHKNYIAFINNFKD